MDKKSRDLVMGKLYLKNKDYKMAEKSLLDHVNLSPEDFQALKMLAQVYENLTNYQKAFEFYERSYLVEPERKGTLLDICRILLIDNSGLDQVDRKKWLQLAIRAFPTNPIVTSLRDTLPAIESNPSPNKINIESELLSKLDRLDQRLTGIEETLALLSMRQTNDVAKAPEPVPKDNGQQKEDKSFNLFADGLKKFNLPTEAPRAATPVKSFPLFNFGAPAATVVPPAATVVPPAATVVPPAATVAPPAAAVAPPAATVAPPAAAIVPPVAAVVPPAATFGSPSGTFGSLSATFGPPSAAVVPPASTIVPPSTSTKTATITPKEEKEKEDKTVNLFADGLKKFNLPTEGSWTATPVKSFPLFNFGSAAATLVPPLTSTTTNTTTTTTTKEERDDDGDGDGDDGVVEAPELPIENTCDMQPIEIKSGEEDEDTIFEHRCKLFRFRDKEYKERGLGNMKVLKHRTTGAGRLIMRRDLVNLVCLNCWSCSKVERVRDTQVRFAGIDASDGEPVMTVFLAKFKTQELTDTFMSHLTDLFNDDAN